MSKMYEKLAKVKWVSRLEGNLVVRPLNKGSLTVDLGQIVDFEEEKKKLMKEKARLEGEIKRGEGMLSNPNFISKAPAAKIAQETEKLESYRQQYNVVLQQLDDLQQK